MDKSPKRMHRIVLKTAAENDSTYCLQGDQLSQLVEEYRAQPGLLRILPEFCSNELRWFFSPDLAYLENPANVERRWRFSEASFEARNGKSVKDCLVVALADPAGIARECAEMREQARLPRKTGASSWPSLTTIPEAYTDLGMPEP